MVPVKKGQFTDPILNEEFDNLYRGMTKPRTFNANIDAIGGMTIDTLTIEQQRFCIIGNKAKLSIALVGTTGGVASPAFRIDVPVTPKYAAIDNSFGGGCLVRDGAGVWHSGTWVWGSAAEKIYVSRYDYANFGIGTLRGIIMEIEYEIDA